MTGGISRRDVLKGGAAVAAGVMAGPGLFERSALAATAAGRGRRGYQSPNIVFIMVDETRFPSVFPTGITSAGQFLQTYMPNVHGLWRDGVKFRHHYSAGVACSPSRAAIVTGLYPHQSWMLQTRKGGGAAGPPAPALKREFPTYGKILRGAGYETPYVGKWHLSDAGLPNGDPVPQYQEYGFDGLTNPDVVGANGDGYNYDSGIASTAAQWLSARRPGQAPFCLTVSFVNPHDRQYFWGGIEWETYNGLYQAQGLAPVADFSPAVPQEASPPPLGFPVLPPNWESLETLRANKPSAQVVAREVTELIWGGISDDPAATGFGLRDYPSPGSGLKTATAPYSYSYWQRGLDTYTQLMSTVDQHIGTVLASIPPAIAANTVFVMTADHGEFAGAHGFPSNKAGTAYEEAYNVPLIVSDPSGRFTGDIGIERDQLTSNVDILPMLATLATGNQSWKEGNLRQVYAERLDLTGLLRSHRAKGRRAVVLACDEIAPVSYNFNGSPRYVLVLRTETAKLGVYADWLPGTSRLDPRTIELEFYDYATERGRLELDNTPDDPRAKAMFRELTRTYLPGAMEARLPGALGTTSAEAKAQFLAFVAAFDALTSDQTRNGNLGRNTMWGNPF